MKRTMPTIAGLIARMRQDLNDEATPYRWWMRTQRHLERTIREYSLSAPREMKTTLATTVEAVN
ncbi:MAG: hypothetical protein U0556_06985 [Dehalococcoidia bacterium]